MDIFSLRAKVAFIGILIIVINCLLFVDYKNRVSTAKEMIGQEAETAANLVSGLIKRLYLPQYKILLQTRDPNSREYADVKQLLVDCKDSSRFRFLFTFCVIDKWQRITYIVDSEPPHSKDFSPINIQEPIFMREGMYNLQRRPYQSTHDSEVYDDPKWGPFLSGYAPIVDTDGTTHLGFVEVDVSKKVVDTTLESVYSNYITMTLILNVVCLLGLSYMMHALFRAMRRQNEKQTMVSDYLRQMPGRIRDKVAALVANKTPKS